MVSKSTEGNLPILKDKASISSSAGSSKLTEGFIFIPDAVRELKFCNKANREGRGNMKQCTYGNSNVATREGRGNLMMQQGEGRFHNRNRKVCGTLNVDATAM